MRIVQLTNLVHNRSGGIRTAVDRIGEGYASAGHERHVILPAAARDCRPVPGGVAWMLRGRRVPASGGYRVLLGRRAVRRMLDRLAPDVVEVSDRWTLTWVARWARARDVRSVALVHEHLVHTLSAWPGMAGDVAHRAATRADRRLVADFDAVVCASRHSATPFGGAAAIVPLGVDLEVFRPRPLLPGHHGVRVVLVGRLSHEKRPDLALDAVRLLQQRHGAVRLSVIGEGPLRRALEAAGSDMPVRFHGHVADRDELAGLVAAADVAIAPSPIEAFGLAALEALACGTPVVATGAGPGELLDGADRNAGRIVTARPEAVAAAIEDLARAPRASTQRAARAVAERYPWTQTVGAMLHVLAGEAAERPAAA